MGDQLIPLTTDLIPGLMLRLPSGRTILLMKYKGDNEWLCQYIGAADARGEVSFTVHWLRAHAEAL